MNYSVPCNEILKLDSKIRDVGVFNSKGETIAQKNKEGQSPLSTDEEKMLVHYTFDRWRHLQNLEYRLGKVRTSVSKHENVTLISLYLDSDLLLLRVDPDSNYPKIIKKIRTMLDDGGDHPYEKKKQTKKNLDEKIAELEAKLSKLSTKLDAKPAKAKPSETTIKSKDTTSSQSSKSAQKTRKKSTAVIKQKTTRSKAKKKTAITTKRSKQASKAKRRATLVANKRKSEFEKANNKIKSLKKALKLAEKSAKKKKTTWQQAVKRASQIDK